MVKCTKQLNKWFFDRYPKFTMIHPSPDWCSKQHMDFQPSRYVTCGIFAVYSNPMNLTEIPGPGMICVRWYLPILQTVKPTAYWAYETTTSFGAIPTMVWGISWFYLKLFLCFYVFPSTSLKWYPTVRQYAGRIVFNRLLSHRLLYIYIYIYYVVYFYHVMIPLRSPRKLVFKSFSIFNITYANYVPYVHVIQIMLYSHHIQIWNPSYNFVFEWVPPPI